MHTKTRVLDGRLATLCLGFFVIMMDATVVTTAAPAIGRDLGVGVSGLQWSLDGYTLAFACLLLTGGSLADRFGARRAFLIGLTAFTVASAACGLAPGIAVLNAARAVQGAASALTLPASLSLVTASFPDRKLRVRAIGVWGGVGGLAAGCGPVLGGLLTGWFDWRPVFLINLPVCALAIVLTRRRIPAPAPRPGTGVDPLGQLTLILGAAALVFALIYGGEHGWLSTMTAGSVAVAILALSAFVMVEKRQRNPMFPMALFRNRAFVHAVTIGCAINLGFYGLLFVLSLYYTHVRGFPPLLAGLALTPQALTALPGSALSGRAMGRYGIPRVMRVGLAVGTGGFLLAAVTATDGLGWLVLAGVLVGFGISFTMPAATAAAIDAVPGERAGFASGGFNAARQLGSAVGVAVLGSFVAATPDFTGGFVAAAITGAIVFGAGGLLAVTTGRVRAQASCTSSRYSAE